MKHSNRPFPLRTPLRVALVGLLILSPAALADVATSTGFVLSQSAVGSGGGNAVSSAFVLDATVSQRSVVGTAGSSSYVLQSGFWTSLSTRSNLRVQGTGSGAGSVSGPGISCALDGGTDLGDCLESVTYATTLGLVAAPDPANRFDGWAGCDSVSTTSLPGDTCTLTLRESRTVIVGFTALGKVGDRVWRDVDGDGLFDASEPGLDGISVTIDNGDGVKATATTSGGGFYQFVDVPPDSYTLSVDTLTLPPGVVPSFDLDGTATPHTVELTLTDGEDLAGADFGYRPLVDLSLTKEDSADPLPGGDPLIYTITVHNPGPSYATEVVVTDVLPAATTRVATSGCAEDPVGTPTCTLGTLNIGETKSFTIEVEIDPAPPGSITNTATVSSAELDLDASGNSDDESTTLDNGPPEVSAIATDEPRPDDPDGLLADCDTVHSVSIERLLVTFDEAMLDPAGNDQAGDVTNPSSWLLVGEGENLSLETTTCGSPAGDDTAIPIASVSSPGTDDAVLELERALDPGRYRLFACGTGAGFLRDLAGNPLDGDGDLSAGGDFVIDFRADPHNRLGNGHFDCELGDAWVTDSTSVTEIIYDSDDVDGSPDSGSTAIANLTGTSHFAVAQCAAVEGDARYEVEARLRLETEAPGIGADLSCTFFDADDCAGDTLGGPQGTSLFLGDTGSIWIRLHRGVSAPSDTVSALCALELDTPSGSGFEARLDQVRLRPPLAIFADDFENGDTSAWSVTQQP